MSNVVKFPGLYYGDIPAAEMLENIAADKPKHAFVIVWPEDGSMPTYHSSTSDTPIIVYRINEFLHRLFNGEFK
ncbi:MAG: hypothetical protein JNM12_09925 [Alphaproteobacteria bacterium]|nr:hypothetical protein [Alphaproteobacteria bacterium]